MRHDSEMDIQKMQPIFIVGMPRSGTTLLRTVVDIHPEVSIGPESHYLDYWMPKYRHLDMNIPDDYIMFVKELTQGSYFDRAGLDRDTVRRYLLRCTSGTHAGIFATLLMMCAKKQGKMFFGDKTPQHFKYINVLLEWFPKGKVIFLLRDPRAIIASLIKVPWAHNYVHLHAQEWVESCRLQKHWTQDSRVILIKYETFVTNQEQETARLFKFLDFEYSPALMEAREDVSGDNVSDLWTKKYWKEVRKPVSVNSIEKWRKILSEKQIALIEHETRGWMQGSGYGPLNETMRLRHYTYWLQEILSRNAARGIRFLGHPRETLLRYRSQKWIDRNKS